MPGRLFLVVLSIVMAATACSSTPSQSASLIDTSSVPAAEVLPTPTALPTTQAVVEAPKPLPTAITLRGGQGIVVPAEGEVASETASDDAASETQPDGADGASYNESGSTGLDDAGTTQPTTGPAPTPTTGVDNSTLEVSTTNGGEVYGLNCARCHGGDGLGDLGYTGILGSSSKYGGRSGLAAELANGHPFTFGFAGTLSAQEIADVAAYVEATFG